MSVQIKNKMIGDGSACYIVFEAGPTHDSLESAIELTRAAAEGGADAIKFQIFDPDRLVADKKQLFSYDVLVNRETGETETVEEPLYDILARRCLTPDEWKAVKKVADDHNMAFFSTIGFEEDIRLLESFGCDSIKIASADVNHFPLLRQAARTGMCIQLDTGNSSLGDIEQAVDVIQSEGNDRIIIHQCPSGYPAHLDSINLRMITTLKQMFPFPAAFSDHTPGWDMDIAAVAIGANLVEKTITKDRMTRSVEHVMSIEPHQFKPFIKAIRDLETAMGEPRRSLHPEQIKKRDAVRRSAFLRVDKKAGQALVEDDVEYRRPGYGIPPTEHEHLIGHILNQDMKAGDMLHWIDLTR
ncbi:N-acetylneuraminate synthase [Hahella sp. CCB-MM4]|uniref:N-acetylneuraminate synthase family protein n=1 Tax=Hahella sp. (strain CCB-MM4) TaxID=1926491 RepID=UPI000B9AD1CF|nr:N-acetylneuraminate synthase family protein [Hahella sp. CCB-MM4]OZG73781.1 N-acetylneuraminate synthase [Hahella sp. CCB-MM4]